MPPSQSSNLKQRNETGPDLGAFSRSTDALYAELRGTPHSAVSDAVVAWQTYFSRFDGNLSDVSSMRLPSRNHSRAIIKDDDFAIYYFSLQTVLSALFRLVVSRRLCRQGEAQPLFDSLAKAADDRELVKIYRNLERNEFYASCGFHNFLADDPYRWLHHIKSPTVMAAIVRPLIEEAAKVLLPQTDHTFSLLDCTQDIYQRVLMKSIRRYLGEYYTPEWLAAHVYDTAVAGYTTPGVIVDPACGSGVFLLTALSRRQRQNPGAEIDELLAGVYGFDINPLAVQAARTNIALFCCGASIPSEGLELPVICADALTLETNVRADFILGNPPWIFWNNLPVSYRQDIGQLMDEYALRTEKQSSMRRLGAAGKDISTLFFYRAMDKLLKPGGTLGFVITQSVFQSTAADEFRRFTLPDKTALCIERVEDWRDISPFAYDTRNKTAVVYARKNKMTEYPVPYYRMSRREEHITALKNFAFPSDTKNKNSFWVISDGKSVPPSSESISPYRPRLGIETKLESVFRVFLRSQDDTGTILIHNDRRRAKIRVPDFSARIEPDLVYPFVGGAGIRRWQARPNGYYIVPHTGETGMQAMSRSRMERQYPLTFSYFEHFEDALSNRSLHRRWGGKQPFYAMYGIGPYSFAPYRVAWKRTTKNFAAVVLSDVHDDILGARQLLANGKVMIIPFEAEAEAHYVCVILNATVFRERINNSITSEAHRDIINVIPWKKYDPRYQYQQDLCRLSMRLHDINRTGEGTAGESAQLENDIDCIIKRRWKL